ncbi:MAG: hypothetical protein KJ728_11925 [Alphaproteobacteria bacterium]|uniref:Uncharacterized protein n=1 Tax=viral metagenome TaxID=1070528 RepID=A0A6M3XBQ6_9ZZZZ|nr:hypothetical protein [Alphaproteobacteria bacterium]
MIDVATRSSSARNKAWIRDQLLAASSMSPSDLAKALGIPTQTDDAAREVERLQDKMAAVVQAIDSQDLGSV